MKFIKLFFLITVVLITYNARVYSQKVPTLSLKAGIEGLLKRLLPEVTEVVAEEM